MPRIPVRLLSWLTALTLGLFWLALSPPRAYACTCRGASNQSSAQRADAIFTGTVRSKNVVRKPAPGRTDLRFDVSAVFKGSVYAEQVVASPTGIDGCGINPAVGSAWLIFAEEGVEGSGDDAVLRLVTRLCSGNLPGSSAPGYLGSGRSPLPGASDRDEQASATDAALSRALRVVGVGALVLLVLSGVAVGLLWRPGRQVR